MDTFFGRYKNLLVLMGVLLAQFVFLGMQVRTPAPNGKDGKGVHLLRFWVVALVAPPEKAVVHTGSGVRGFWGSYLNLRGTREENQRLRDENNRLRLEQASLLEDARQGQRLQSLLQFREKYVYQTVPAQVIGTSGNDQSRLLLIDKGAKDGLAIDQPVITPDGIVGKVRDVFPHTAQVLEINDQTSGAGVLLEKTRLRGVLRGNAYGQPQVIDILPDERIKPGESVVTSGGDQIFPRGLPVGVVEKIVADPEREPYEDIVIKPAANLQHLEEVLVVTETSDQLPPKVQKDLARSQAVGAAEAEKQRTSDILSDRLPTIVDPNSPDEEASAEQKPSGGEEVGRPIQPPQPIRADRYTPDATPAANQLTPGTRPAITAAAQPLPVPSTASPGPAKPRAKVPAPAAAENPAPAAAENPAPAAALNPAPALPAPPRAEVPAASRVQSAAGPVASPRLTADPSAVRAGERPAEAKRTARPAAAYVEPQWVGNRNAIQGAPGQGPQR